MATTIKDSATTTGEKRSKLPQLVTPKGEAIYPKIQFPDTKFKPDGEFSIKLRVKKTDAKPFRVQLEKLTAEAYAEECKRRKVKKLKTSSFSPITDETDDSGKATGNVIIKASQDAVIKGPNGPVEKRVGVFDARNQPIPNTVKIGSGSVCRVAAAVVPYFTDLVGFGTKLRLQAVQVLERVEPSGPSAKAYGFAEEDGGFDSSEFAPDNSGDDDASSDL